MTGVSWDNPIPGTKWVRTWRLGEWLTTPVSPLFATLIAPALTQAREKGGTRHLGWKLPKGWTLKEPWFCIVNGYFFARADFSFPSFIRFLLADVPRMEKAIARWRQIDLPKYFRRLNRLKSFDLQIEPVAQLLQYIEELCEDAAAWWHLIALEGGGAGFMERMFAYACRRLAGPGIPAKRLLWGIDSPVLASERRLYSLACEIKASPELRRVFELENAAKILASLESSPSGRAFLGGLNAYLEEYGHQTASLDLLFPTPGEDPGQLVPVLQKMVSHEIPDPARRLQQMASLREQAERDLAQSFAYAPLRRRILTRLLDRCRALAQRREETVFFFQLGWPLLRKAILAMGERLAAAGVLRHGDEVFFLTKDELWGTGMAMEYGQPIDSAPLRAIVRERRETWEQQRTLLAPDRIPPVADPIWQEHRGPAFWGEVLHHRLGERVKLVGQAASPGYIRGPARVMRSPADFARFRKGDVLVAATANPVWTPLFALAAAMVTESGGITSHTCTVAREYGIPAVVATGSATQVIIDDQMIEVDGDNGVVYFDAK